MPSPSQMRAAVQDREAELVREGRERPWIARELAAGWEPPVRGRVGVITGPRRAGKSVFAFQRGTESGSFAYVNFEDERLQLRSDELGELLGVVRALKGEVELLILDEVQNVPGWERFVARLSPSQRLLVTGSNARLLSGELATLLTGRHHDQELFPFSFLEVLRARGAGVPPPEQRGSGERAELMRYLQLYLEEGGFPFVTDGGRSYLADLYRDVVERDVMARHRVRNASQLRELSLYLVSHTATEVTHRRLANSFGLRGFHTVSNWVRFLEDAYVIFEVYRFSPKLKERALAPKKVYAMDTGLARTVGAPEALGEGRLLETLVAIELHRRRAYGFAPHEVFYWKDQAGREVDFVLKEGPRVTGLLQVTHASRMHDLDGRESDALVRAGEQLRCRSLQVLTWDLEGELTRGGRTIELRPVLHWLLDSPGRRSPSRA